MFSRSGGMDRLNHEYTALFSEEGVSPPDKFWNLWDKIRKNQKDTGVVVDMRRSKLVDNMTVLILESAIPEEELNAFSEELQFCVRRWLGCYRGEDPNGEKNSEPVTEPRKRDETGKSESVKGGET